MIGSDNLDATATDAMLYKEEAAAPTIALKPALRFRYRCPLCAHLSRSWWDRRSHKADAHSAWERVTEYQIGGGDMGALRAGFPL